MTTSFETERELAVFIGTIGRYFQTVGGALPAFLAPTLELVVPPRLACTGYMPVSGRLTGWIALSLPSDLLRTLLQHMGEDQHDETAQLDLVAEITSTLTSNAREHFGEHLRVAPPLAALAADFPDELTAPPLSFRLPFQWQGSDAFLLIALQR
ncbi:MAG: chemotaxis protein CheX [Rariglobus sp.]